MTTASSQRAPASHAGRARRAPRRSSSTLPRPSWLLKTVGAGSSKRSVSRAHVFYSSLIVRLTCIIDDLEDFLRGRQTPVRALCLGLGSPCTSANARVQLALLLRLCAVFRIVSAVPQPALQVLIDWLKDRADVALFDPVFDDTDRVLLHDLGCKYLDTEQVR
jgi:hypothetical protein